MPTTDKQQETYRGFPVRQLRAMFDAIANRDDWRAPIDAYIPMKDFAWYAAAVAFCTATELVTTRVYLDRGMVQAEAPGYRAGPAGDH